MLALKRLKYLRPLKVTKGHLCLKIHKTHYFIIFKKQAITQLTFIFVLIFKLNYFCLN